MAQRQEKTLAQWAIKFFEELTEGEKSPHTKGDMADIELVIKIPEELYEAYKGRPPMLGDAGMDMIAQSISTGTPLPKGHGRLVDADEIDNNIYDLIRSMDLNYGQISEVVDTAPTILEADRGII